MADISEIVSTTTPRDEADDARHVLGSAVLNERGRIRALAVIWASLLDVVRPQALLWIAVWSVISLLCQEVLLYLEQRAMGTTPTPGAIGQAPSIVGAVLFAVVLIAYFVLLLLPSAQWPRWRLLGTSLLDFHGATWRAGLRILVANAAAFVLLLALALPPIIMGGLLFGLFDDPNAAGYVYAGVIVVLVGYVGLRISLVSVIAAVGPYWLPVGASWRATKGFSVGLIRAYLYVAVVMVLALGGIVAFEMALAPFFEARILPPNSTAAALYSPAALLPLNLASLAFLSCVWARLLSGVSAASAVGRS